MGGRASFVAGATATPPAHSGARGHRRAAGRQPRQAPPPARTRLSIGAVVGGRAPREAYPE
eukprot:4506461-Pyramimonas_sp.AAC.1